MTFGTKAPKTSNGPVASGLAPGDYTATLDSISEPFQHKTKFGEKESIRFSFTINGKKHEEVVTNTVWSGGNVERDGQTVHTSPSKLYRYVRGLTGIAEVNEIKKLDGNKLFPSVVRVRLKANDKGFAHVEQIRMATGAEMEAAGLGTQTGFVDAEEEDEEEVPF